MTSSDLTNIDFAECKYHSINFNFGQKLIWWSVIQSIFITPLFGQKPYILLLKKKIKLALKDPLRMIKYFYSNFWKGQFFDLSRGSQM